MFDTRVHLVGGFLGSGKTTAIAAAARHLIDSETRVGVITNDQGRYLVDTLFMRMQDLPTVEVLGGCFCCNYDDFEEKLSSLETTARPDVIFAESVGSCADVVATVLNPLLNLKNTRVASAGLSVFADSRLLAQRMSGSPMPFSEDIVYIFDKQLEEAGRIVINKADLLDRPKESWLRDAVREMYPGKPVMTQNSLKDRDIRLWLDALEHDVSRPPDPLEDMDYRKYGAGEAELAWLDKEILLRMEGPNRRDAVVDMISEISRSIRDRGWAIGHLKFLIRHGGLEEKVSITTVQDDGWDEHLKAPLGSEVRLLINARVAADVPGLEACVTEASERSASRTGAEVSLLSEDSFHPGYPVPTHRMVR